MKSYKRLYDIIVKLRSPEGCPWDIEQTPQSMAPSLIEESYELIEAIQSGDHQHIAEEIGDVVLVASMIGYMNEQEKNFDLDDVFNTISEKLIRRHPHVFGDVKVADSDEVLKNWDDIKQNVEGRKKKSLLESIPKSFPPLERGFKMQKKAAKEGFDWPEVSTVFEKLNEEIDELHDELNLPPEQKSQIRIEEECGDILFTAINLCRKLKCDPSVALDRTNRKFQKRFEFVQQKMKETGIEMSQQELTMMDRFWDEAKTLEK